MHDVPESDWKVFRELRQHALERFCKGALDEVQTILRDGSLSHHNRYLEVLRLVRTRDDELAQAFNDARRCRMLIQLGAIQARGLLEPDELERFTQGTRARIESLAKEFTQQCRWPKDSAGDGWAPSAQAVQPPVSTKSAFTGDRGSGRGRSRSCRRWTGLRVQPGRADPRLAPSAGGAVRSRGTI